MKVLIGTNPMGLETAINELQEKYPEIEVVHCPDREKLIEMIGDADIYMGWLDRDMFLKAEKLKWIQSPSSGVNHYLTVSELVEGDVLLTSASGTHGGAVAESALAMILAFTRGIRPSIIRQPSHTWAGSEIRPSMIELTGTTMGILGFGAIGKALAKRAKGLEMRVLATDLYPKEKPDYVDELWGMDRMNDLLRESDFVVVAVPYTPNTVDLVGAAQIALMKPSAMLVGMSRGGIINEDALVSALRSKQIAAAALDVFATEPLPEDSELWDIDNLLVAAHIAGGTQYEGKYVLDIFRENLDRFVNGNLPLRNQVDKNLGW